jgi:large subunit ribosomal protein MRP49
VAEHGIDEIDAGSGTPLEGLLPRTASGKSRVPRSLPATSTVATRDMYEHRVLLRLLDELAWRCDFVRQELTREVAWRTSSQVSSAVQHELKEWSDRVRAAGRLIERCRDADVLEGVTPLAEWKGPSERMRRDPRYRKIGELWRMVHGEPFVALRSPAYDLPVDDLPALYEQWCLLEVAHTLVSMGEPIEHELFEMEDHDGTAGRRIAWRVRLRGDRPLLRIRCAEGAELDLTYQRRFRALEGHERGFGSLDPFARIPDIVIGLSRPGQPPALLVFDAKYRVADNGGIPEEALGDAYTYLAALGHEGRQVCRGVFLLFPGSESFEQGAVGAFRLLPGQTGALRATIERVLLHAA